MYWTMNDAGNCVHPNITGQLGLEKTSKSDIPKNQTKRTQDGCVPPSPNHAKIKWPNDLWCSFCDAWDFFLFWVDQAVRPRTGMKVNGSYRIWASDVLLIASVSNCLIWLAEGSSLQTKRIHHHHQGWTLFFSMFHCSFFEKGSSYDTNP